MIIWKCTCKSAVFFLQEDDWEDIDEEGPAAKDMTIQQAIESIFASAGDYAGK